MNKPSTYSSGKSVPKGQDSASSVQETPPTPWLTAKPEIMLLARVWLALLVLLTLTVASTFVPLGMLNAVLNAAIAFAKAALVAVFFMHVIRGPKLIGLIGLTALTALAVLFVLAGSDYLTRTEVAAPWQQAQP